MHPQPAAFSPCQRYRKHRHHHRHDRHHRPANAGQEVFILAPDRPAQGNVGLPQLVSPARIGLSPPKARIVCQWAYRPFNVAKTRRRHHRPQAGHARRRSRYSEPVPPLSILILSGLVLSLRWSPPRRTSTACDLACQVLCTRQRITAPPEIFRIAYCTYMPIGIGYRHDKQHQYERAHHECHQLLPSIDSTTGQERRRPRRTTGRD